MDLRRLLPKTAMFISLVLVAMAILVATPPSPAYAAANEIVVENAKPGNPASEWDVQGAGDPTIQGFATRMSVDQGGTVDFKIDLDSPGAGTTVDYRIDIYRLGYYGGAGARKVATIDAAATIAKNQDDCTFSATNGNLLDCGNWNVSASWPVPADQFAAGYRRPQPGPEERW